MADAYLNYGDAAKAEELYTAALAKGATDKDRVYTRLGIAQVDQGKWAAAKDSFSKVAGTRNNLAKLWLIYVAPEERRHRLTRRARKASVPSRERGLFLA